MPKTISIKPGDYDQFNALVDKAIKKLKAEEQDILVKWNRNRLILKAVDNFCKEVLKGK